MPITTDFEIQSDKDIRYIGAAHGASGAGYYSGYELHVWLQGLADDESYTGDDIMDITKDTPSDKLYLTIINLLNGFNIDDASAEHIYDASIIQTGGDVIYDGIQVVAPPGTDMQIIQNGAVIANDFWNTIPFGGSLKGLNPDSANGVSHRFMLKVRTGGSDIDGRGFIATTRVWGKNFGERKINSTGRGINVVALPGGDTDLNNATAEGTVATWATIANLISGYNGIDVNNDTVNEFYYSKWNRDIYTINQFYERMKYLVRQGSGETLYGLNGELFRGITHEINIDNISATDWDEPFEPVSWSGGTGQLVAINDVNAPTKMWIQLLTGIAPTDGQTITGGTSGATADVNVTVVEKTISAPFCGLSTGSSLIGAFGIGLEATDLSSADKVFALDGNPYQAPNYQQGVVGGMDVGDYVIAANNDTGNIDFDQLTLNTSLSGVGETAVVVTTTIPSDTPLTGTIRIQLNSGKYRKVSYTSWSGSTFVISSTNFSGDPATAPKNVFISYLDIAASGASASFTAIYSSPRTLFIRVRDGGASPKKTFETTAIFGAGGFSISTSKISDA